MGTRGNVRIALWHREGRAMGTDELLEEGALRHPRCRTRMETAKAGE